MISVYWKEVGYTLSQPLDFAECVFKQSISNHMDLLKTGVSC